MTDPLRIYEPSECGTDGYPLAWHKGDPAVKDLVREEAGHRCVRCCHPFVVGETPGEWSPCDRACSHAGPYRVRDLSDDDTSWWSKADEKRVYAKKFVRMGFEVEAQWRVLTVHHLTGEKHDLRWWNLAALDQRCHLEIQGRVRMEQVYPHEHSPWFKPYAAGYYAATYLNEDLTREETEGRLDELLALELAA
jgi:hypothetical protein